MGAGPPSTDSAIFFTTMLPWEPKTDKKPTMVEKRHVAIKYNQQRRLPPVKASKKKE